MSRATPLKEVKDRPELTALVKASIARFEALTPDQKRAHRAAQRRSWVRGELMLEHPNLTADQANILIDDIERE